MGELLVAVTDLEILTAESDRERAWRGCCGA
jgi:hypothetical protein